MQEEKEKRKEEKKRAESELTTLFKPVITQQTIAAGQSNVSSSIESLKDIRLV